MKFQSKRKAALGQNRTVLSRNLQILLAVLMFLALYSLMFFYFLSGTSAAATKTATTREPQEAPAFPSAPEVLPASSDRAPASPSAMRGPSGHRKSPKVHQPTSRPASEVSSDPSQVVHEWYPNDKGPFAVLGAYAIDGDRRRPSFSDATSDTLVVVVGTGEFVPGLLDKQLPHGEAAVPALECLLSRAGVGEWTVPAVVHTNGTVYQGRLNRYEANKYDGEKSVWISCLVEPPHAVPDDGQGWDGHVVVRDVAGEHFRTQPVPLQWFLSGRFRTAPEHRLVQCSAAIYGVSGTRWLAEWIQYHQIVGFDHMHLYLYKPSAAARQLVEHFRRVGFVTLHDWSAVPENGIRAGTPHVRLLNWEHGQRLARNDCYMRNRGRAGTVLFTDVDELPFAPALDAPGPGSLQPVLDWCEQAHERDPDRIGFALESVTTPPFPVDRVAMPSGASAAPFVLVREEDASSALVLSQIQLAENRCQSPYNCGQYHRGRQKYLMRTRFGSVNPNGPLFYHAVSQEYEAVADRLMLQVPPALAHIRHHAGHFSHVRKGGLQSDRASFAPLPASVLQQIAASIAHEPALRELYAGSPPETFLQLAAFGDTWRFAKEAELKAAPKRPPRRLTRPPKARPAPPPPPGAQYLTFERYGGRLNNQLLTYDWVFRLSKAFGRVPLIHRPTGSHDREHWIGLPESREQEQAGASLWDLPRLRQHFEFLLEYEVAESHGALVKHPVLGRPWDQLPPPCVWEYSAQSKYISVWLARATKLPECRDRVHFRTASGLVHPYKSDTSKWGVSPLTFWRHFRPNPYLAAEARRFLDESGPDGRPAVGIHTRAHNSYGEPLEKSLKRCRRLAQRTLGGALAHVRAGQQCCPGRPAAPSASALETKWRDLRLDDMCHLGEEVVQLALAAAPHPLLVLASDHEQQDVDQLVADNGGLSYAYKADIPGSPPPSLQRNAAWFKNIEGVLMDMTLMTLADWFFGSPSSTVSIVICFWRLADSEERGEPDQSNMCEFVIQAAQMDRCEGISCDSVY